MTTKLRPIVLSVSSEDGFLDWAKSSLSEMGIQTLPARTAEASVRLLDALRSFTGRTPDLVLLAEPVEDSNPLLLCRRLRGLEGMAGTPVLLVMRTDGPVLEQQARSAGGSGLLKQPVAPADLRTAIKELLADGAGATKDQAHIASFLAFKRALIESLPARPETADRVEEIGCRDLYALGPHLGISSGEIARRLASYLGLPHLARILPDTIDWSVLPHEFCAENCVLPMWSAERLPVFVLANPFVGGVLDALDHSQWADRSPGLGIADPELIRAFLKEYQSVPRPSRGPDAPMPLLARGTDTRRTSITRLLQRPASPLQDLKVASAQFGTTPERLATPPPPSPALEPVPASPEVPTEPEAPAVAMADELLREASRLQASDIHIEPKSTETLVRFRIDGEMQSMRSLSSALASMLVSRLKALGGLDIAERRRPQDGVVQLLIDKRDLRLRLATASTPNGESLIIRLLEPTAKPRNLTDLGMTEAQSKILLDMANRNQGLILVVGTTGSGKSTTIHSVLTLVDGRTRSMLSVEDPVEYLIPWANQQQVNEKAGVTFESLLRSTMRQDPNVLFVGEIRDFASAKASIDFASSGHLTITTLHSSNAMTAIFRLERLGIQRGALAEALLGVVAQKLLRVLCPKCKRMEPITTQEAARLAPFRRTLPARIGRPVGCDACRGSGYRGRTAVYEILPFDDEVLELVRSGAPVPQIRMRERERGYYLISDHAVDKVCSGMVSLQDAYDHVLVEEVSLASRPSKTVVAPAPVHEEGPPGQTSVLVVDDDSDILALVERMLAGSGYRVVLAHDSVDALIHLARRRFDLMLLDIGLPDMDGLRLIDILLQKGIDTMVLVMTALSEEELARRSAGLGPLDVLRKPFTKEDLVEGVAKAVRPRVAEAAPAE